MSKYNGLWTYIKAHGAARLKLTYAEIERIAGIPIDHSFLTYKKELLDYGYCVTKISMKEETVLFEKVKHRESFNHGITIRRFDCGDAAEVQTIIHRGLREINGKDYPVKLIEDFCAYFTVEKILSQAESAHTYVAVSDIGRILGTGSIAPFWNSETESILLTIYVLPERIGTGIGTAIINALEADEYFQRADRIEIPSSITAVAFYRKMGYVPKDGNAAPDDEGMVRMEKIRR